MTSGSHSPGLEDHAGDVIRKARDAAGLAPESAASLLAAGAADYAAFEQSGRLPESWGASPEDRLAPLTERIHLDARRLVALARGWRPAPRDLTQWRELRAILTERNGIAVLAYLVWDEVTREAALFDTGWDAAPIFDILDAEQLQLRHLFLTHLHEDHVAALAPIRDRFPKLHLHTNSRSAPPQHRNRPNDCLHLGSLRILNRDVPGHAEEGVIYLVGNWPDDAPHVALIGDTLFAGSMATGFQSADLLRRGIRDQILSLPPHTLLCPGHGPVTTVAEERVHNPFFA